MFTAKLNAILLISFLLISQVNAKSMSMMEKALHASPMPNLSMLIIMNAKDLDLNKKQIDTVKAWRKSNNKSMEEKIKNLFKNEAMINKAVLDGENQTSIDTLKNKILELRKNIMETKYLCSTVMQKTLNEKQWSKLMEIKDRKLREVKAAKENSNAVQAFLKASPMPKLMFIIIVAKDKLKLSKEQDIEFEKWRGKYMLHWSILFDDVLQGEKKVTLNALDMKPQINLMEAFDTIAKKRRKMAQMSLNCRDNMKKILNDEQWEILLKQFKSYL